MNPTFNRNETAIGDHKLNDIGFRLILIPFFGIAIPLLTGMINHSLFTSWEIKFSYLYTIMIAFIIWHGNRYLLFTLRSYFNWFNKPIRKIIALLLAISFYTIPVSALLLTGWYHIFLQGVVNWDIVFTATLIIMICVVFITHVYETVFLVRDSETEMLRNARLEQAKMQAELEALKNQIDPHFIFNSLNTLSHLMEEEPKKARAFNDCLADVYRYILQSKSKDLILLRDEIDFLKDYFSLLNIRFGPAIELNVRIDDAAFDQYLVPPISLQILAENAIKHNEFSLGQPLLIDVYMKEQTIVVENMVRKKSVAKPSSKIGLQNLAERYKLITEHTISIREFDNKFSVVLPALKLEF